MKNNPAPERSAKDILSDILLPEVSSLEDLEAHLRLPRDLITEELVSGRLRALKLGGRWLVHRDALKAWLNVYGGAA